jgi:N-acetylglucosaminyldiphosphoundecaprenol N-acetyl-beta-D-mannosaminyltransferase
MKILGVNYDNITLAEALDRACSLLRDNNKSNIFFLNADCLYKAQKDSSYREILNSADLVLPDGIGLRLATKMLGGRMKDNCNGTDFSPLFMQRAAKEGYKIFFLGGKDGVAEKAAENIRKKIPGIQIVGVHFGYFDNDGLLINTINNSRADILFVSLGVPFQEKWIYKNRNALNPKVCLGVGALLDYLSERIARAPKLMRAVHLEWLWRIGVEPKRMFKRYIIDGLKFFGIILKQKYNSLRLVKKRGEGN